MDKQKAVENKINAATKHLMESNSLEQLRAMHMHAFNIASRAKSKESLAKKLATWTVTGNGNVQEKEDGPEAGSNGKGNGKANGDQVTEPLVEKVSLPPADQPQPTAPDMAAGPSDNEKTKIATDILSRAKGAWDLFEALKEEKRSKLAEIRQKITKTRDKIGETLNDDKVDHVKKLDTVDGLWRTLSRFEDKRTAVNADYGERIKNARQNVKTEFDNTNQLNLF